MLDSIEDVISRVEKLPTINTVAFEVLHLCSDKEIPIPRLVKVISGDHSLTAQILKVANSGYFNYPRTIYSLDRAIVILGFNLLRDIAVSLAVFSVYNGFKTNGFINLSQLWQHTLRTGLILKILAEEYDQENKDILYITGLLHDIGKLVLVNALKEDYAFILEKCHQERKPLFSVEKKFLGFEHSEVGARLLEKWNLPPEVVTIVRYHHEPSRYPERDDIAPRIRWVYFGNILSNLIMQEENKTLEHIIENEPEFPIHFSYSSEDFTQILQLVESELQDHQDYLKLFEVGTL
ncbi:MAG: HDOD domain-containing protein [Calditrichia bacterium]